MSDPETDHGNSYGGAWEGIEDLDEDSEDQNTDSGTDNTNSQSVETSVQKDESTGNSSTSKAITQDDLPHRVRCDSPKDERETLNMYVSKEDKQRIRELNGLANREFDQKISKIDVYLAAMRCDFYDDDSFLAEMEKIGYGFFD